MRNRSLFALLVVAAVMASAASCTCSGEPEKKVAGSGAPTSSAKPPSSSANAPTPKEPTLTVQPVKLANGMQVELVSGPCGESAALAVLIAAGIDHDPPGRSGMAQLAARLLASVGGNMEGRAIDVGGDHILYAVSTDGAKLAGELDGVAAWMSKFSPTEDDLKRERGRLLEEIGKLAGVDAEATAKTLAEESLSPTRGKGRRLGVAEEVLAITLDELKAYWEAHLRPGNARLAIAGRYDLEKIRAHIDTAFGSLPAGSPPKLREPSDSTVKGTLVMGDAPTAVAIAVPAPPLADAGLGPFLVLAARVLAHAAPGKAWSATYDPIRRPDVLFVTGPVGQGEQPEPAANRIRDDLTKVLKEPLAPEDTKRARERFELFVSPTLVAPAVCARDARAFAVASVRRAQLEVEKTALQQSLDATTQAQLEVATKMFEARKSAAVIAGGKIQ